MGRSPSDVLPEELRELVHARDGADRDAAWSRLLARHGALILHVSRTVTRKPEDAMDAFAAALEQLRADDFRRLRAYEADGRSKFTTWLVVVVQRIALDFMRQRYGRRRPAADGTRARTPTRAELRDLLQSNVDVTSIPDDNAREPGLAVREAELQARLAETLGELGSEDRLLLKLRFEDGLSAREIATILRWPTPFHVYRRLAWLTTDLRRRLIARGVESASP